MFLKIKLFLNNILFQEYFKRNEQQKQREQEEVKKRQKRERK